MRRLIVLCLVLVATGCGSTVAEVPITVKAPPQTARLSWQEPYPAGTPALVFGVSSFSVTAGGWEADVSVENRSKIGWEVGDPLRTAERTFGVLLFPNDDLSELERLSRSGDLPPIRPATRFRPRLPAILEPGSTWRGTISAPGALPGGLWVRLAFGTFSSVGEPPSGVVPQVIWFTDHAHRLSDVAATAS